MIIKRMKKVGYSTFLRKYGTLIVLLFLIIYFSAKSPYFLTTGNFMNIGRDQVVPGLIAMGMTFPFIAGTFDLSVGNVASLVGVLTAALLPIVGPIGAIILGLLIGAGIGLVTGTICTRMSISGVIVSLSVSFILTGAEIYFSHGFTIPVSRDMTTFLALGQGWLGEFAVSVMVLIIAFIIFYIIEIRTKPGRYIATIGDNPVAAYFSGVKVNNYVTLAFMLSAVLAGLAGILSVSRGGSATPLFGSAYLMDSFAIIFLGSTIIKEGRPHLLGTFLGLIFFGILVNGMTQLGFTFAVLNLFKGFVLIAAVAIVGILRRTEIRTVYT